MSTIQITSECLQRIRIHSELMYPNEGCGLLFSEEQNSDERVLLGSAVGIINRKESETARKAYLISPRDLIRAETEYRRKGVLISGIFHSHPDKPAVPSEEDGNWMIPGIVYGILPVYGGTAGNIRFWMKRSADEKPTELFVEAQKKE